MLSVLFLQLPHFIINIIRLGLVTEVHEPLTVTGSWGGTVPLLELENE